MNIRFWTLVNGSPCKLTVNTDTDGGRWSHGRKISHSSGGPTDEGWSASGSEYYFADGGVYREWWADGRDCDGRMSTQGTDFCRADMLQDRVVVECLECHDSNTYSHGDTIGSCPCGSDSLGIIGFYPEWSRVDSSQRDYAAEAAGY